MKKTPGNYKRLCMWTEGPRSGSDLPTGQVAAQQSFSESSTQEARVLCTWSHTSQGMMLRGLRRGKSTVTSIVGSHSEQVPMARMCVWKYKLSDLVLRSQSVISRSTSNLGASA